jgi:hypothetical protein
MILCVHIFSVSKHTRAERNVRFLNLWAPTSRAISSHLPGNDRLSRFWDSTQATGS